MKLNPFVTIYGDNNELHLSLSDKIDDTFKVFYGEHMERLGIFDYLTFWLFYISSSVFNSASNLRNENNSIMLLFFIPTIVLSGILTGISFPLRFLTSSILTFISIPIVILVHVISIKIKQADIKKMINADIQACVNHDKNSLTITIPADSHVWLETIIEQLIDQLNQNPTITELTIDNDELVTDWLEQLILKLEYVTTLSAPKKNCDNQALAILPQSNLKQLHIAGISDINALYMFLTENTKLAVLSTKISAYATGPENPLEEFNRSVEKIGIQYPCRLLAQNESKLFSQIDLTMIKIRDAHLALGSCFELYKIWCTDDKEKSLDVNRDILQCIMMVLIQMCPKDILEKNPKGLSNTLKSNGFFIQKTEQSIGFDPQEQSTNRITEI